MNVFRERPSQRLHHRVTAPFYVEIGERVHQASDWSLGGFCIERYRGELPAAHTPLDCTLSLPFQGFNISFEARAEVVWRDEKTRTIGVRFLDMGDRERGLLTHFVEELVRGSMVAAEETIKRIDVPVTPVPTTPDTNPVAQIPLRRWPVKVILISALYAVLGLAVFGYIALAAYASLFRLQVDMAVVVSERLVLGSPARGRLLELPVAAGQSVEAGALLAVLSDRDLSERRRRAEASLAAAVARLEELEAVRTEERARAADYDLIAKNNVAQLEVAITGLTAQRSNISRRLARARATFEQGWTTLDKVEDLELELANVASQLARKEIHLQELRSLQARDGTRIYEGRGFVGDLAAVEAAAARAAADVETARQGLAKLEQEETRLTLVAPWPGVVRKIERPPDSDVDLGDPVVVVERTGPARIEAFLTQAEIGLIREGDRARVYLPSRDRWLDGAIAELDRTDGFIETLGGSYRARAPDDRSAKAVLVTAPDPDLAAGLPAVVYFRKRSDFAPLRLIQDWLSGA